MNDITAAIASSIYLAFILMRKVLFPALLGAALLSPQISHASVLGSMGNWADRTGQNLANIYDHGNSALFVSGYTWHDPSTYTAAKRATLNSHAWGLGWSRQLTDANGNVQMVYAMAFSDSHRNAEPVVGYAKQWLWNPVGKLNFGAGYTAGVTSRADIFKNIPFPIALPLFSVGYGRFTVYGTFIPRINSTLNNGNVAFFFAGYAFQ